MVFECVFSVDKLEDIYSYLVFKIFKNCKISENCINLSALRNLKPVLKKKDKERERGKRTGSTCGRNVKVTPMEINGRVQDLEHSSM